MTPKKPNEEGSTMCTVRWIVETEHGWLGAYDIQAFDAYAAAEVAKERERCAVIAERGDNGDWSASTGDYDARRGADIAKAIRSQDD